MKKITLIAAVIALFTTGAMAQVHVNVNFSVGRPAPPPVYSQPVYYNNNIGWNGVEDYYFLPEIGVYDNVARHMYFYPNGKRWMMASCLPARYNGYAWNSSRRVLYHGRPDFVNNRRNRMRNNRRYQYNNDVAYQQNDRNRYDNNNRGGGRDHYDYENNRGGSNNGRPRGRH